MYETKICDHCGKGINATLTICPFCGGHIRDRAADLTPCCPRCKEPLVTYTQPNPLKGEGKGGGDASWPDEKYELCQDCGGLWLDRIKFRKATRESDVYREERLIMSEYIKKPVQDTVTYVPCVRCGKIMNRKNFAKISGVIIDECGNHGVWLDAGELEKIRHFIADGGLERIQDREIEKNRIEIERLAIKVDQTAFIQKLLNFWSFKRWLFGG